MEREAYEKGNLCFRDWEDSRKNTLKETTYYKNGRLIKMSLREKISSLTTDEGYSFGDLRRAISALTRRN